ISSGALREIRHLFHWRARPERGEPAPHRRSVGYRRADRVVGITETEAPLVGPLGSLGPGPSQADPCSAGSETVSWIDPMVTASFLYARVSFPSPGMPGLLCQ